MQASWTVTKLRKPLINKAAFTSKPKRFYCNCISQHDPSLIRIYGSKKDVNSENLDIHIYPNFITDIEHDKLVEELEPYLARKKYQSSHWDHVISKYRETQKSRWSEDNMTVLNKMKAVFPSDTRWLFAAHVLDLDPEGHIDAHVDSIKFSGDIIAGLCLMSPALMKLRSTKEEDDTEVHMLLQKKCFYILRGPSRYDFSQEITKSPSYFDGTEVKRTRRIAVLLRNEANNAQHLGMHGTLDESNYTSAYQN